jgi:hypothetical protein
VESVQRRQVWIELKPPPCGRYRPTTTPTSAHRHDRTPTHAAMRVRTTDRTDLPSRAAVGRLHRRRGRTLKMQAPGTTPVAGQRLVGLILSVEVVVAWVEQCGSRSWRVRYRRQGFGVRSVSGFGSRRDAGLFHDRCFRPDTPGRRSGGMGTVSDDIRPCEST